YIDNMDKLTTIIIDDEPRARETIKNMLMLYCPELDLVGEAVSVASGLELIRKIKPEVVLLDIQMSDGSGFDLLKQLDAINFALVFITAFDEYAVKAFKFSAIDYLLKPIDPDELISTMERIKLHKKNEGIDLSVVLNNLRNLKKENKKLVLKTTESIFVVGVQDIIRCESSGNYTHFYLTNEKPILVSHTLKEYEEMLKEHSFIRVHQSHLVNLEHIKRYDRSDGGMLVMTDNKTVPVATRKKDMLLNVLGLM
nr:LytTR family DNA-binding domain-containing protein [Bacteroidales bacterium]